MKKYALLPEEIDRESLKRVEASLPDSLTFSPAERYVVCRIVRAEGDPHIATAVRFSTGAVERGIAAIQGGAEVITDVRMVEVGISKALLAKLAVHTRCHIDGPQVAARAQNESTTRSVAAMREMAPFLDGAVVAVGNAPTALLALLDLIAERRALAGSGHRDAGGFRSLRRGQGGARPQSSALHRRLGPARRKFGGCGDS